MSKTAANKRHKRKKRHSYKTDRDQCSLKSVCYMRGKEIQHRLGFESSISCELQFTWNSADDNNATNYTMLTNKVRHQHNLKFDGRINYNHFEFGYRDRSKFIRIHPTTFSCSFANVPTISKIRSFCLRIIPPNNTLVAKGLKYTVPCGGLNCCNLIELFALKGSKEYFGKYHKMPWDSALEEEQKSKSKANSKAKSADEIILESLQQFETSRVEQEQLVKLFDGKSVAKLAKKLLRSSRQEESQDEEEDEYVDDEQEESDSDSQAGGLVGSQANQNRQIVDSSSDDDYLMNDSNANDSDVEVINLDPPPRKRRRPASPTDNTNSLPPKPSPPCPKCAVLQSLLDVRTSEVTDLNKKMHNLMDLHRKKIELIKRRNLIQMQDLEYKYEELKDKQLLINKKKIELDDLSVIEEEEEEEVYDVDNSDNNFNNDQNSMAAQLKRRVKIHHDKSKGSLR